MLLVFFQSYGVYVFIGGFIALILFLIEKQRLFFQNNHHEIQEIQREVIDLKTQDDHFIQEYIEKRFEEKFLFNHKHIKEFISYLNILGLLGTFLGLTIILPELSKLNESGSLDRMKEGMETAFFSSIFGLFAGIIMSIYYNRVLHKYNEKFIYEKNSIIREVLKIRNTDESGLSNLNQIIKNLLLPAVNRINQTVESNTKNIDEMKTWANKQIEHNMLLIKEYSEQSHTTINEMIAVLKEENENISDIKREWSKSINILNDTSKNVSSVSKIIHNFEPLYQSLINQIEEFSGEFASLFINMKDIVNKTTQPNQILSNMYEVINSYSNNSELLKEVIIDLKKSNEAHLSKITQTIENNSVLKEMLNNFLEQMKVLDKTEIIIEKNQALVNEIKENQMSLVKDVKENQLALINSNEKLFSHLKESSDKNSSKTESIISKISDPLGSIINHTSSTKQSIDKLNRNLAFVLESILEGDN